MTVKPGLHLLTTHPASIHLLGGGVLAAVAAAVYMGFFGPSLRDSADRQERMAELHSLMANNEQIAAEHQVLQRRLGELQKRAATVRKRLPLRSPAQDFIERATQLASAHDVKMEMCTASAPATGATHSQVEVACRLSGSYAGICRYLAAIDHLSQVSKVSHLEISSVQESDAYPAQVVFQLYYRTELHDTEMKRGTL
jgi:Tfp pilus assembly protein PilO